MKKISILTATRAEYGLLKQVILKLKTVVEFDVRIVVTGTHLSPEFGMTYREIENDGIKIDEKIEILLSSDTATAISKAMGLAMIGFADYFSRFEPDMLLVLGDRYETLAICCAAMNQKIPIAHLYGGDLTEGSMDEMMRHAITKLSYLHFTNTEECRNRVIQLGEQPNRVFSVGEIGIENIRMENLMSKAELEESLMFKLNKPYALVTFHPATLENSDSRDEFQAILNACEKFKEMNFIFTKANADANGRVINQLLEQYANQHENAIAFDSLGMTRYLSAVKYCDMVIGNSSSGLIEAPSFGVPTINIGDRQKGRHQGDSVINCKAEENDIVAAMALALSEEFKKIARNTNNPYGDGNTTDKIIDKIKEFLLEEKIDLKKKFYDCEVK